MRSPVLAAAAALAFVALAAPSAGQTLVRAPASSNARQEILVTNQNLAVVAETRRVELPAGAVELLWEGAPASARTETWNLTSPAEVRWTGLSASTGTGGEETWLASLVGRRVRVVRQGGGSVDAEVVAVHGATTDRVLFREGSDLVYGEPQASLVVPGEGARAGRPAGIALRLSVNRPGPRELVSRYLVSGLTWQADYSLTFSPDERSARLDGWFTVDDATGSDFAPDRLRLLAGVLRTAAAPPSPRTGMMAMAPAESGVAESTAVSESRVYEIPSPGPLRSGRTTFPLANNARVAVAKRYVARSSFWGGRNAEGLPVPVAVRYRVAAATLGRALPAGVVRAYTEDGSFFAGEDRIPHTPEATDFEIETSEAFDLTARRQQTAFTQIGPRENEAAFEVTVTSRKSQEATVLVREEFPGDWTILESSRPATRRGASTAEFSLPVPPGGTIKLTYRVRVRT
jgi:hypothetical protein